MTDRRNNLPRKNVREGSIGNILEELVSKYGLGDTVPVSLSTGNYDSGRTVLPDSEATLTAITTQVTAIIFSNLTLTNIEVTVKDGDGDLYVDAMILGPKEFRALEFHGVALSNGIKWFASAATSVVGHVKGNQDA